MHAQLEPTVFLPVTRAMRMRIEATIEQLLGLLDEIDSDADLEPANDDEPSLGWTCAGGCAIGATDDRESE